MTGQKVFSLVLLIFLLIAGCSTNPEPTPVLSTETATNTALPSATSSPAPSRTATTTVSPTATPTPEPVLLIGAGDIALCGPDALGDEATADIVERYPSAVVFTAGDNVQDVGRAAEYRNCFAPTWGRFMDRLHPVPGNHEYMTEGGAPYFAYFGETAGEAGQGWYSYNLGGWHIAALNSNCDQVACGPDSAQARWLREDLAASDSECTLLYWHHPRFSSGLSSNYGLVSTFWKIAYEYGAEVVVSGHDHDYERFAPQDGDGNADPRGIREFVVGTGGVNLRFFGEPKPNSEVRDDTTNGVILFRLYPDRYEWEFIPVDGGTFTDKGEGRCSP